MYCMIDPELCRLIGLGAVAADAETGNAGEPLDRAALAVPGLVALAIWVGGLGWT